MVGKYVAFEGPDGAGKSSVMQAVAKAIAESPLESPIELTRHPGSTALGAHIRQLVKNPKQINESIEIDALSRQLLYMTDTVNFIKLKLIPALENNRVIFADRSSFISAVVYGEAEGLRYHDIDKLLNIIDPPKMDRLYILKCPWQVRKERLKDRDAIPDHFDDKPIEFLQRIDSIYDRLIDGPTERTMLINRSVSLRNVKYIDATLPLPAVVNAIVADLKTVWF